MSDAGVRYPREDACSSRAGRSRTECVLPPKGAASITGQKEAGGHMQKQPIRHWVFLTTGFLRAFNKPTLKWLSKNRTHFLKNSVENTGRPTRVFPHLLHTQPPVCRIPASEPTAVRFLSCPFTSLTSPLLRHDLQAGLPDSVRQCVQTHSPTWRLQGI